MKKGIILTLVLAVVAFTSVGMWGDIIGAGPALKGFSWYLIPVIAMFGFGNDLIKFLRWHIYLAKMGIDIPMGKNLMIFLSGLSMSATPGKVGFLIKSQMLKSITNRRIIATSPVIMAELYMDLICLAMISLLGIGLFSKGIWVALILCVLPAICLIPQVADILIKILSKLPVFSGRTHDLKDALDNMFRLFGPKVVIMSFIITLIAWISEGVALMLIIKGLGLEMGIIKATSIFGFSTLIGVLSMLPGGLIVTDASLMGLIVHAGIPATPAALAAIMARVFTLWLAVLIGSICLVRNRSYVYGYIKGNYSGG